MGGFSFYEPRISKQGNLNGNEDSFIISTFLTIFDCISSQFCCHKPKYLLSLDSINCHCHVSPKSYFTISQLYSQFFSTKPFKSVSDQSQIKTIQISSVSVQSQFSLNLFPDHSQLNFKSVSILVKFSLS